MTSQHPRGRTLLVTVDAGAVTCRGCNALQLWDTACNDKGEIQVKCSLFNVVSWTDEMHDADRCQQCLAAEEAAGQR